MLEELGLLDELFTSQLLLELAWLIAPLARDLANFLIHQAESFRLSMTLNSR